MQVASSAVCHMRWLEGDVPQYTIARFKKSRALRKNLQLGMSSELWHPRICRNGTKPTVSTFIPQRHESCRQHIHTSTEGYRPSADPWKIRVKKFIFIQKLFHGMPSSSAPASATKMATPIVPCCPSQHRVKYNPLSPPSPQSPQA